MIGQDLQAGPHDEQHEEHVQEMLDLQPPGKPESTEGANCAMPGMVLNKGHDARKFAQALRQRNQAEQRRGSDRQRP